MIQGHESKRRFCFSKLFLIKDYHYYEDVKNLIKSMKRDRLKSESGKEMDVLPNDTSKQNVERSGRKMILILADNLGPLSRANEFLDESVSATPTWTGAARCVIPYA